MTIVYHVDRVTNRIAEGQLIDLIWGKDQIQDKTNRADLYLELFSEGVSYHGWNYLLNRNRPVPSQDTLGMIEIITEQVRRVSYPERLSRFQAFFSFSSVTDAKRFIELYPVTMSDKSKQNQGIIWEVEVNKIDFEGDMHGLSLGESWIDCLVRINTYWQGRNTNSPLRELLIRPPVRIIRQAKVVLLRKF